MNVAPMIRAATSADAEPVVAIYNHYVSTTAISFEEEPITTNEMTSRMAAVLQSSMPWLVAERDGQVLGYAYAARWRERHGQRA